MSLAYPATDRPVDSRFEVGRLAVRLDWIRRRLPARSHLDDVDWGARHRAVQVVLLAGLLLATAAGLRGGHHPPGVFAGLASGALLWGFAAWPEASRSSRELAASLGLLFVAGVGIQLSGGLIEMHFLYFVALGLIALYIDWVPFLCAGAFVFVHHGIVGTLDPGALYGSQAPGRQPWAWAGLHAAFVLAGGSTSIVAWQAMERSLQRDRLTRLPNHARMCRELSHLTDRGGVTVVLLDVDDFGSLNDRIGFAGGNVVLREVAARLSDGTRRSDFVCRDGSDSFAVLVRGNDVAVGALAERLAGRLAEPLLVDGRELRLAVSMGLAKAARGLAAEEILGRAGIALHAAQQQGRGCHQTFTSAMGRAAHRRGQLLADLPGAAERGELALQYQPIVDLTSGRLDGVEALVRWDHPTLGRIMPDQFIPLAEEGSLILTVGRWVLDTACAQLAAWQRELGPVSPPYVSVNMSSRQLAQEGFTAEVADVLARHGVPPRRLMLELTETAVMADREHAVELVAALSALGVLVAIDDFGTGYSSLDHLLRLSVHHVKIDRSFTARVPHGANETLLVHTLCQLMSALGRSVVVEGIERPEQEAFFRSIGRFAGQGYLFSVPLDPDALADLARSGALGAGRTASGPAPGSPTSSIAGAPTGSTTGSPAAATIEAAGRPTIGADDGEATIDLRAPFAGAAVRRVLVVEDDLAQAICLRRHLERRGLLVVSATSLTDARDLLDPDIDVVVTDLRLGGESGWELIDELHRLPGAARPGVVVLSGLGDPATAHRAAERGCAFLTKPYHWEDLDEQILRAQILRAPSPVRPA